MKTMIAIMFMIVFYSCGKDTPYNSTKCVFTATDTFLSYEEECVQHFGGKPYHCVEYKTVEYTNISRKYQCTYFDSLVERK